MRTRLSCTRSPINDQTENVIAMLRTNEEMATKSDVSSLARGLHDVASDVDAVVRDVAILRQELVAVEARLTASFEKEIRQAFDTQTRTLVIGLVGAFLLTAMTNVLTLVLG